MSKIDEQSRIKRRGNTLFNSPKYRYQYQEEVPDLKDPVLNISITRILIFFLNLLMSKVKFYPEDLQGPL